MRQAGLSFFTTAPMSSPLSIPVVPVTPAASAETGRRAEKSWGMVCTRWRVTRRKSVALGPMASGVTRRLPRPATRTDPCLGRVGRASSTAVLVVRPGVSLALSILSIHS